jgi:hypothetical protein
MTEQKATGWADGLLQDYNRKLSNWLSTRIDAKHVVDTQQATEQFCDGHCTWTDHHPSCGYADEEEDLYRLAEKADNGGQP